LRGRSWLADATAWQRLVEAAGGEKTVAAAVAGHIHDDRLGGRR
jgi:hypothetical protein